MFGLFPVSNIDFTIFNIFCTAFLSLLWNISLLCFNRSFTSHEKSKYWSSKNTILPRQIVQGSGIKY